VGLSRSRRSWVPVTPWIARIVHIGLTAEDRIANGLYPKGKASVVRLIRNMITCHATALLTEGVSFRHMRGSLSRKPMYRERLGTIPDEKFVEREHLVSAVERHDRYPVTIHVFDRARSANSEPHLEHSFVIFGKNLDDEFVCAEKMDTKEKFQVGNLKKMLDGCGVLNVFVVDEQSFPG
jgi:hypothetical protein